MLKGAHTCLRLAATLLLVASAGLPAAWAQVKSQGEEIPTPAAQQALALPPAVERLFDIKSGGGAGADGLSGSADSLGTDLGGAAPPTSDGLGTDLGGTTTPTGGSGLGAGSAATGTPAAVGGTEYDLVGTLFNGNSLAFTQAVLASGGCWGVAVCL